MKDPLKDLVAASLRIKRDDSTDKISDDNREEFAPSDTGEVQRKLMAARADAYHWLQDSKTDSLACAHGMRWRNAASADAICRLDENVVTTIL